MDPQLFTASAWGAVTQAAEGYAAFVPDSAPRTLQLSQQAWELLDEAAHSLGVLTGMGHRLPNPHLLIAPYLRREAVLSSRIEGTQATMADLYASELGHIELVHAPDVMEVQNYIAAHEHALASPLPLSLRLMREMHRILMRDVRGQERHPGEFRTYQNYIGGANGRDATYVGPPVPQMRDLLDDLERFLHEHALRPLIQAAVAHYQFEAIHPFGDGNGRVGRLLIPLFLRDRGLLPQPLLYLSAYFERNRRAYYDALMRVSTHSDWDGWIRFFLAGVRDQAKEAADLADALTALQARYRETLQSARVSAKVLALVDALFVNPLIYTSRAQELLGVSAPTARAAIKTLDEHGIVREITGRHWGKIFEAEEIHALLRGD
jgi:cell filamentation protein, protein adenylyltransferase